MTLATELNVGDNVYVTIRKGGYYKDTVKGRIVKVTATSYVVESGSHWFYSPTKRDYTERAFRKSSGAVSFREAA